MLVISHWFAGLNFVYVCVCSWFESFWVQVVRRFCCSQVAVYIGILLSIKWVETSTFLWSLEISNFIFSIKSALIASGEQFMHSLECSIKNKFIWLLFTSLIIEDFLAKQSKSLIISCSSTDFTIFLGIENRDFLNKNIRNLLVSNRNVHLVFQKQFTTIITFLKITLVLYRLIF